MDKKIGDVQVSDVGGFVGDLLAGDGKNPGVFGHSDWANDPHHRGEHGVRKCPAKAAHVEGEGHLRSGDEPTSAEVEAGLRRK